MSKDYVSIVDACISTSMSYVEEAVQRQSALLLGDVHEMVEKGVSHEGLMAVQDRLADLLVLHATYRGIEAGGEGPAGAVRLKGQREMERKQRGIFDNPIVPDISRTQACFLGKYLSSRALALMEIAYLEKESAILEARRDDE